MQKFQSNLIRQRAFESYDRLAQVRAYCEANLAEKITLASAAEVAGLEYTYFSSFFHSAVGVRFGDWLRFLRVRKAQAMIRESKHPISRVAVECGFNNVRTFQRAFKAVSGVTPRQFRRESRLGFAAYNVAPKPLPGFRVPVSLNNSG